MAEGRVLEAVREGLGLPAVPPAVVSVADEAAGVVDRLGEWHEHELAEGEADLSERLAARFSPEVLGDPRVLEAIDWTLEADRGAHAAARVVVARDLAKAFASPRSERERRVAAVLDAERARVKDRAGTRVARATRNLLAAVRLPDEAVNGPAPSRWNVPSVDPSAPAPRVARHRDGSERIYT